MIQLIKDLVAFHAAIKAPVLYEPQVPSADRLVLRIRLIREECCAELLPALEALEASVRCGNMTRGRERELMVKIIDGLLDTIVVCVGTALELGATHVFAECWKRVMDSNMAKRGGPVNEFGKAGKPEGWKPPDIAGALWPEKVA